jgi:hypothetical protein
MTRLCEKLTVKEPVPGPALAERNFPILLSRCFRARQAIWTKGLRKSFESEFKIQVDWSKTEMNSRTASLAIREVLGIPSEAQASRGKDGKKR